MDFIYDNAGRPYAIVNGNATSASIYYYILNQQGDVIRILGPNNTVAATYTYNAWGEVISSSGWMANQNPLRYRGYFQDNETGFYYCQSRYYDPSIGRWIDADQFASTGQGFIGYNMFAYCNNNPVNSLDYTGTAPETWQWIVSSAMIIGGIALTATGVGGPLGGALICSGANSIIGSYTYENSSAGWIGGLVSGAVGGMGAGISGGLLLQATESVGTACISSLVQAGAMAVGSGMAATFVGDKTVTALNNQEYNIEDSVEAAVLNGAVNCVASYGAGSTSIFIPARGTGVVKPVYRTIGTAIAVLTEAVCDSINYVANLLK